MWRDDGSIFIKGGASTKGSGEVGLGGALTVFFEYLDVFDGEFSSN